MARDYMELSELLARVKESVEDAFPERYWVKAEIGSWSPRANGHCYLNLVESDKGKPIADIRAMIWKWQFPQLKAFFEQETGQKLQAGITVLVRVQVNFSEMFGISLFIDDIDPAFTVGEQALAKKKALEKLTAGGYLEMQQELALPRLPYRLAGHYLQDRGGLRRFPAAPAGERGGLCLPAGSA
jgi:Exonuclease VII, large subunit